MLLENFSASVLICFWSSSSLCSPLKHRPLNSRSEGSCSYLRAALLPLSALGASNSSVTSHPPSTATGTEPQGHKGQGEVCTLFPSLGRLLIPFYCCNSFKRRDGIGSVTGSRSQPESSPLLQSYEMIPLRFWLFLLSSLPIQRCVF